MRWEKVPEQPGPAQVVRALSFSARTEDGQVVAPPAGERRRPVQGQTSFTSIDVKKSRRVARQPASPRNSISTLTRDTQETFTEEISMAGEIQNIQCPKHPQQASTSSPKAQSQQSSAVNHIRVRPRTIMVHEPLESSTQQTLQNPQKTSTPIANTSSTLNRTTVHKPQPTSTPQRFPPGTQSLERPSRVNKLVLRVPSAASEYQHKRVIHSVCVTNPAPVCSQGSQTYPLADVPSILCESSTRLIPDSPEAHPAFPRGDYPYTPGQVISSITLPSDNSTKPKDTVAPEKERWCSGGGNGLLGLPGGVSDSGSVSLSNFSSGDGVSTLSRISHHLSYFSSGDGLSTPTHMGSTTRLVHAQKTSSQKRCNKCCGTENISTALSVLSFAATLGNLLRLPRMVYFHGGGVFLLIYVLITLVFGIPLTFLEIGLGQFCQHGTVKLWRAVNLFRGVGYAKAFLSLALAVSYSTQMGSALALLVYTANEPVPFSECSILPSASENGTWLRPAMADSKAIKEQCLLNTVFAQAPEQPMWFLIRLVFIILVWGIVFICVMKRSLTYRRAMYLLFPGFFILTAALLVESSSPAKAANIGLDRLFTFEWTKLGDIQVWYFAMVQMFFSLQLGFGNISTCAGRIYPKTNAFWTSVCLVVSSLCMGMACVILAYLWLGALDTHLLTFPVPEAFMVSLAYQVQESASASALWPTLAYLLVLVAGLSSLIALTYTLLVASAVETKRRWRWRHINGAICITACLLAILSLIPGELSVAHVLEHYLVSRGVIALTVLELVGFAMVYGCSNLYNDLEFVIGSKLSSTWKHLWLITPCVFCVLEICSACLLPLDREYGALSPDPLWQLALGWGLYGACWIGVLGCALHQVWVQVDYNLSQKLMSALKPSRNWGPVDPIYRHCWVQWRNRYNITGARDFTLKRRGTRDYTHHARTATPVKTDSLQWSRH